MKLKKTIIGLTATLCFATNFGGASVSASAETNSEPSFCMQEMLTPIWEGETSYMESVLPVMDEGNGIKPIPLLYPIEEIISVQNASLTVTYTQGEDYTIEDGELLLLRGGDIPMLRYEEYHPQFGQSGFEAQNGGYICFHEGAWFHERQIVVTYKHKANYKGYVPEGKGDLLPNVREALSKKDTLNVLVFGDSISVGANASGFSEINVPPYMPSYAGLFAEGLKERYGVKTVNVYNPSVGGKDSAWGVQTIHEVLSQTEDIDLAIVAFGMNDGGSSGDAYTDNVNAIISAIQEKNNKTDILAVATMLPNPDAVKFSLQQPTFYQSLLDNCEREGVAVVNMTSLHESLLQRKRYGDMTGNNVNHPNDYLMRVYAQALLKTLETQSETQADVSQDSENQASVSQSGLGCVASGGTPMIGLMLAGGVMLNKKKKENEV